MRGITQDNRKETVEENREKYGMKEKTKQAFDLDEQLEKKKRKDKSKDKLKGQQSIFFCRFSCSFCAFFEFFIL